MNLPCMYLSRPAVVIPDAALDNETVLARVRESFRGTESEWDPIAQGVQYVLGRCNTQVSTGQYGGAVYADLLGSEALSVLPLEELLLGAVAQF